MKPIETYYRGCHFRSRIEARWAVFFQTLGIKWWHEPEGFSLRFDYEKYAADMMDDLKMTEDELLQDGIPQTFQHLDGKEYTYLPDFYLPELRVWLEIKGPNPTPEDIEKAFLLHQMVFEVGRAKTIEAWETKTDDELRRTIYEDFNRPHGGTYVIYGDIPWLPEKGNIVGWGVGEYLASRSAFLAKLAEAESDAGESQSKATEYRRLLRGQLKLCWQECPLCSKIGIGEVGKPYCGDCLDDVAEHIFSHLAGHRVMGGAEPSLWMPTWPGGEPVSPEDVEHVKELNLPRDMIMKRTLNPADLKAMKLTKDLMNLEFFTSGHKSPRLHKAYSKARSARFEHGESP